MRKREAIALRKCSDLPNWVWFLYLAPFVSRACFLVKAKEKIMSKRLTLQQRLRSAFTSLTKCHSAPAMENNSDMDELVSRVVGQPLSSCSYRSKRNLSKTTSMCADITCTCTELQRRQKRLDRWVRAAIATFPFFGHSDSQVCHPLVRCRLAPASLEHAVDGHLDCFFRNNSGDTRRSWRRDWRLLL